MSFLLTFPNIEYSDFIGKNGDNLTFSGDGEDVRNPSEKRGQDFFVKNLSQPAKKGLKQLSKQLFSEVEAFCPGRKRRSGGRWRSGRSGSFSAVVE
jgi:hypothetical protein